MSNWNTVAARHLKLPPQPPPKIITFDARCEFRLAGGRWSGKPHGGKVTLPDGGRLPPGVASFAAPAGPAGEAFFVMSLPSVWQAAGVTSEIGLERLMEGVLIHEIMHTRQFYFVEPRLKELTRRYGLPDDLDDDSLQRAFEKTPAYVSDFDAERNLLFAAAAAPDKAEAKRLARLALEKLRSRRARRFTGESAKWVELDEIFLTMEGAGQWAAYAWFTDPSGGRLAPATALRAVRRGGRSWSQDEGLAIFLVVDRLLPNWQALAFAKEPVTAEGLLALAVR